MPFGWVVLPQTTMAVPMRASRSGMISVVAEAAATPSVNSSTPVRQRPINATVRNRKATRLSIAVPSPSEQQSVDFTASATLFRAVVSAVITPREAILQQLLKFCLPSSRTEPGESHGTDPLRRAVWPEEPVKSAKADAKLVLQASPVKPSSACAGGFAKPFRSVAQIRRSEVVPGNQRAASSKNGHDNRITTKAVLGATRPHITDPIESPDAVVANNG